MTAYFPFWQKLAAVMRRVWPSTSFHRATFLSGIFQSRSFPSSEPLKKYLSSWKEEADLTINTARESDWSEVSLDSPWDGTQWLWQNRCAESSTDIPAWICATIGQFYPWTRTAGRSSGWTEQKLNKKRQKREQLQPCSHYTTLSFGQESGGQRVITLHDSPSAGVAALLGLQTMFSIKNSQEKWHRKCSPGPLRSTQKNKKK